MPNPLSEVSDKASAYACNPGKRRPLSEHPELALLAMEAIDSWANVEAIQLSTFVRLLGGSASMAAAIFLSLETQGPKTAAINAAALLALSEPANRLLSAIQRIAKTNEKRRNRLVHWSWGSSPELPNSLLLMDPRTLFMIDTSADYRKMIFVYNRSDFESIIADNHRLCDHYNRFRDLAAETDPQRAKLIYDELAQEPAIRERLDRPASPTQSPS